MKNVLLVGVDRELLNTRCALLQRLQVKTSSVSPVVSSAIPSGVFNLLVLCHSLDPATKDFWIAQVQQASPQAQVVELESALTPSSAIGTYPVIKPDPYSLLQQVSILLDL